MMNFAEYPGEIFLQCDLLDIFNSSDLQTAKCNLSKFIGIWAAYLLPLFAGICMISDLMIGILIIAKANRVSGHMIWICGICLSNVVLDVIFIWLWQFPSKGLPYATNRTIFYSVGYISQDTCRMFYYTYSYSTTLMCNMRVCASINRCLAVYMPSKYKNIPIRYRWYVFIIIVISTGLLMIPFGTATGWFTIGQTIRCWMNPNDVNINFVHTFISNLGPIQTIIVIILDAIFVFKVRKYLKKQMLVSLNEVERSQLRTSSLLLLSSISFVCISLPQSVLSVVNRLGITRIINIDIYIPYYVGIFLWYLNSVRNLFDFVIYFKCFKMFHFNILKLLRSFYSFLKSFRFFPCLSTRNTSSLNK